MLLGVFHSKPMFRLSTVEVMKHIRPSDGTGFVLSDDELHRLHARLVEILADIDRICRQSHLRYFLGGGTALGAIRHGGFIPWDDDMDLCMPRADFDRFVPLFRAACGDRYWVHSPNDPDTHGITMSRVRLKGTSVRDRNDFNEPECGAFVDIFIYENTFDNPILRALHGTGSLALGLLVSLRKFWRDRAFLRALVLGNPAAERAVRLKSVLGFFVSWLPLDTCIHLSNGWNRMCRSESSRFITCPSGRKHFFGQLAPREEFATTRDIAFEGLSVKVGGGIIKHMIRLYGENYMTPPPNADREQHVFLRPFSV